MRGETNTDATVLVCHPDESMCAAYQQTLAEHEFDVRATGAPADLRSCSETGVGAAVISSDTPELSMAELRAALEGTHVRVALLVPFDGETPAIDSLPERVDECLAEPVPDERLVETVEHLLARARYDARLRRCFDLARRVATAEADPDTDRTTVRRLRERLERLRTELGDSTDGIGAVDRFAVAAEPDSRIESSRPSSARTVDE